MEAAERTIVKALEQALVTVRDREGIQEPLRDAMQVVANDMLLLRTDPVEFLLSQLRKLTAEQRQDILSEFCSHCGGESPCNCWRDD